MAAILMIAYIAAAYWATNKIWWSKRKCMFIPMQHTST